MQHHDEPIILSPGVIHEHAIYEMKEFQRRTGISDDAKRELKARGMPIFKVGRQGFVFGGDFIRYVRKLDDQC